MLTKQDSKQIRKTVVLSEDIDSDLINFISKKSKYEHVPYSALVRQAFRLLMDQETTVEDNNIENSSVQPKTSSSKTLFKGYEK
ncbi:hypothetical protein [Lactiplantibacillus plantarum]|uniref:hypothetical protein n=1 Tax=Lactiplantibacillus plantarum TaxID=1590 RepID=UPI001BA4D122|nr:hypothetical protein [Lactiplantibacillus plantarum]MBS0954969.1 hypothetical protein [Lactiplantibacillus plantarum]